MKTMITIHYLESMELSENVSYFGNAKWVFMRDAKTIDIFMKLLKFYLFEQVYCN